MKQILDKVNEIAEVLNDTNGVTNVEWVKNNVNELQKAVKEICNLPVVTNRTCSFCGGTEFESTESQYNDVDNDYDRCEITYCTKCRNTHSIDV